MAKILIGQGDNAYWADQPYTIEKLQPENKIDLSKVNNPNSDSSAYKGIIDSGNAMAGSLSSSNSSSNTDANTGLADILKQYLGSISAPQSTADMYNQEYANSGIDKLAQDTIDKQKAVKSAKNEFDLLNAQMQGLNAEAQGVPIQIQQNSEGRGITVAGAKPLETSALRNIALRSIPLQGQILAAQAKVSAAQGDVDTANNTYKLAQDKLNQVFKLRSDDATNLYNYQQKLIDTVFNYATEQEKEKLTDKRQQNQNDFVLLQNNIKYVQDIAKQASDSGQFDISAKITQLDPKSPTYLDDVANLQKQIVSKDEQEMLLNGYIKLKPSQLAGLTENDIVRMPNGDIWKKPSDKMSEIEMYAAKKAIDNQYQNSEFKVIGKDDNGNDIYGFVNTSNNTVTKVTGTYGGQCGAYINDVYGTSVGDSWESKQSISNTTPQQFASSPQVNDVVVFKTKMPYGHIAAVTAVNGNQITITESNWNNDEKIGIRTINVNDPSITGVYRGATIKQASPTYQEERKSRTLQSVRELIPQVSRWTVGVGSYLRFIPGTPAADFAAELDTLKSSITFGELTEMREASKTGGALGQVSDYENRILSAALGALDTKQSPENFKEQLRKIEESITRWQKAKGVSTTSAVLKSPDGTQYVNLSDLTPEQIKEAKSAGWK